MPSFNNKPTPSPPPLSDLKLPSDIHISPDGKKAIYTLESFSTQGKTPQSSLWIAQIGVDHSARKITSGLFKDERPRWSPDGRFIAFLSDRGSRGSRGKGIYLLEIGGFGEAVPLLEENENENGNGEGVKGFEWSGDGRFIAFVGTDGRLQDGDEEGVGGDDDDDDEPVVFGGEEENRNSRLRVVDVERRGLLHTLTETDQSVDLFSWSPIPASHELAYTVSDSHSDNNNTAINIISVDTRTKRQIITTKNTPITSLTWTQTNKLHFIAPQPPPYTTPSVHEAHIKSKQHGSYFGWTGEATSLHRTRDSVVARIQHPTHESAHVLGVKGVEWPFPAFFTSEWEITSFDAFRHPRGDGEEEKDEEFTLVVARSSPQLANEVWSVRCKPNGTGDGTGHAYSFVKLSSHNSRFDGFRAKHISTTTADGWECDGWLFTPKTGITISRRLPGTVVLLQNTPTLPSFSMGPHLDVAYLTSAGYAVLCPTVRRQNSGIGERYSDLVAILRKAVAGGLVDESRVTISGWREGGFLSSLAVIRDELSFRAVVCGGGVVDWDFVGRNGDGFWPGPEVPSFEGDGVFEGGEEEERRRGRGRAGGEKEKEKAKKKTPLLILHGREDDQVPVSGPLAFWRERQRWNGPVQMVLYPREGHVVRDRRHLEDLWKRVLGYYERYLV